MAAGDKQRGLYGKYVVTKISNPSYEGDFYVLDLQKDPFAIPALRAYAEACADEYPLLSEDLKHLANQAQAHQTELAIQKAVADEIAG